MTFPHLPRAGADGCRSGFHDGSAGGPWGSPGATFSNQPKTTVKNTIGPLLALIGIILLFFSPLIIWVSKSSLEASAYNRVTGSHVSTWDAMWIDLRVVGQPTP